MSSKLPSMTLLAVLLVTYESAAQNAPGSTELPRFDRLLLLETTSERSANVSIGDLNGDGNLDIVLAKGRHWPLVNRVLLGNGRGQFPHAHDLGPTADRSYSCSLADMDGDGDLDVVVSNDAPDPKRVYLNDGNGHFRTGSTYGRSEWSTRNASVADVDGDGRPDIIVANRTGNNPGASYICLNRGAGEFDADCIAFSNESATTITPADFDGDGLVDLAVPHRDGGQSHVYLNDRAADLADLRRIPFGPPDAVFRVAKAADLNRDGLLDLVTIDRERGVNVYFGQSHLSFSSARPIAERTGVPYALAVGDLDLDGAIDVVVGRVKAPSVVYFNDGSGQGFTPVQFGDDLGTAYGFAIGDLDKDGRPDVAVARSDASNAVYFAAAQ